MQVGRGNGILRLKVISTIGRHGGEDFARGYLEIMLWRCPKKEPLNNTPFRVNKKKEYTQETHEVSRKKEGQKTAESLSVLILPTNDYDFRAFEQSWVTLISEVFIWVSSVVGLSHQQSLSWLAEPRTQVQVFWLVSSSFFCSYSFSANVYKVF